MKAGKTAFIGDFYSLVKQWDIWKNNELHKMYVQLAIKCSIIRFSSEKQKYINNLKSAI